MSIQREFHGPNIGYVLELYERFQHNPESLDAATRAYFEHWTPPGDQGTGPSSGPSIDVAERQPLLAQAQPVAAAAADINIIVGAANLTQAIRSYGHLSARLDPLGSDPHHNPALDPTTHGLTEDDLRRLPASLIGGPIAANAASALEAIQALRAVYSSFTGYDYEHIHSPAERTWLRQAAESGQFCFRNEPIDPAALLERLTQVEVFERFLHRVFPGKTRFSLEGLDMLVPMLDEIIADAACCGTRNILIGMAHRGRLNVLAHVLDKPYTQILAEFKDPTRAANTIERESLGWTGDVRYHAGARHTLKSNLPASVTVSMAPNPSHLEAVNPVVQGMARAAGTRTDQPGAPPFDAGISLPILIHGDAAFPGQGVVAETLNFSRLEGYQTGGTVHIIANNQLGFTTDWQKGRSTLYASDLAKGFEIPIVHVNADQPEACLEAARLAIAYRSAFHKDFLIDLIGYRRYGHNEGDEPAFTQPLLYEKIAKHPTVRERWAGELVQRGEIAADEPDRLVQQHTEKLQHILDSLQPERDLVEPQPTPPPAGAARRMQTAISAQRLQKLNEALLRTPEGFTPHGKLERPMRRRRQALQKPDEPTIDWGTAEQLALASILEDGIAIRFTGEDVERGTFGHRHAVFHDARTGQTYTPLQALPQAKAAFEIHDSPLSENAAVGFEYGYNVQEPHRLVIWEAQYGDFINGAQVMIDEFVTSARAKWGQTPSLVLLLPHGFEGQGPDHSSGRLERFLGLAAETNMRIANPTTAAQYFHLLRRQALLLQIDPLPLIIMSPKSLLRHPNAASSLRDLTERHWQPLIEDERARTQPEAIRRLVLCSGKVYVDLVNSQNYATAAHVAVARIEQLYPFPGGEVQALLTGYAGLREVIWLQEEPENMGAWTFVRPRLEELIDGRWPLRYVGRPANSSPAEGSSTWHAANQSVLIDQALNIEDMPGVTVESETKHVTAAGRNVALPAAG